MLFLPSCDYHDGIDNNSVRKHHGTGNNHSTGGNHRTNHHFGASSSDDSSTLWRHLAEIDAYPVGWLPDQKLVVTAFPDGCDQAADVWLIHDALQGDSWASLLVTDVDASAVRAAVPDPPPALGDVSLDEFA